MVSIVKCKVKGEDGYLVNFQQGNKTQFFATTNKEEILSLLDKLS